MMRRFCLIFLCGIFLLAIQQEAQARCITNGEFGSESEIQEYSDFIEEVAFVGLLHIDDVEFNIDYIDLKYMDTSGVYKHPVYKEEKERYIVTATPIQSYIGNLEHSITFKIVEGAERVGPGKKGQIEERIIYKNDDGSYRTTGQCEFLPVERWDFLREQAKESVALREARNTCEKGGGKLWVDTGFPLHCLYPASDKGELCIDSVECEGVCIAKTDHVTGTKKRDLNFVHGWTSVKEFNIKEGSCGEWKNQKGSFVELREGKRIINRYVRY